MEVCPKTLVAGPVVRRAVRFFSVRAVDVRGPKISRRDLFAAAAPRSHAYSSSSFIRAEVNFEGNPPFVASPVRFF